MSRTSHASRRGARLALEVRRDFFLLTPRTDAQVAEPDEVEKLMAIGARNRSTHSNNINEHSSRSHLVLSVQISRGSPADDGDGVGELNLIDLAGSERLAKARTHAAPRPRRRAPHPPRLSATRLSFSPRACTDRCDGTAAR